MADNDLTHFAMIGCKLRQRQLIGLQLRRCLRNLVSSAKGVCQAASISVVLCISIIYFKIPYLICYKYRTSGCLIPEPNLATTAAWPNRDVPYHLLVRGAQSAAFSASIRRAVYAMQVISSAGRISEQYCL